MNHSTDRSGNETAEVRQNGKSAQHMEWRGPLRGIIPPVLTPLLDRETLDVEGLERLVPHMLEGGVHGLFVLGTTGEGPGLGYRLRRELIERVVRITAGRVPLVVGVTDTAFSETVALADHAAECGADAAVVAPPYYYSTSQSDLLVYLEHLIQALPLPVLLYNIPSHTKVAWEPPTVRTAADLPGVVGLKDSSGDLEYFRSVKQLMAGRPDFTVLIGPEELLADGLRLGAPGGVPGGSNLFPDLYVKLYEAAIRSDWNRVYQLHEHVMAVCNALYGGGQYGWSFLKGLKCAMACRGICSDFMAEPFHALCDADRQRIEAALTRLVPRISAALS